MNVITVKTALEIACHEALIRQAYKDSVGVWTWSVGLTSATGHDVTRYIGQPQTVQRCMEVWLWAMEKYAQQVREAFAGHPLTEAQFAAALSFHWNTGAIKRASWVDDFKGGFLMRAEDAFMAWNKPPEIIERRKAEADLLFRGRWSNDGKITEYTRITSRSTPDWRSGKRIDVTEEIAAILGRQDAPPPPPPDTFPAVQSPQPRPAPVDFLTWLRTIFAAFSKGR